jgi:hypothetical protein
MKRIKTIGKLAIYEASEKELNKDETQSKYHLYLKDTLESGYQYGDLEWECDNLKEAIEWATCY